MRCSCYCCSFWHKRGRLHGAWLALPAPSPSPSPSLQLPTPFRPLACAGAIQAGSNQETLAGVGGGGLPGTATDARQAPRGGAAAAQQQEAPGAGLSLEQIAEAKRLRKKQEKKAAKKARREAKKVREHRVGAPAP